ncbi:MAG: fucose isomerase [Clostridia bacterium]|nr:fucose isomerase [Clostridia bacterium]
MKNIPEVKLGVIAVSRDCFVITLSERRRKELCEAYRAAGGEVEEILTTVENEKDMKKAVAEAKEKGCNALTVLLGNFGPETPETLIAKYFEGPVMYIASAEEGDHDLFNDRGDAYCGMLNCSYNLGLRHLKAFIPSFPVVTAKDGARLLAEFIPIATALLGLSKLKIFTFGPRPYDFFACNAPIKALYDLGVEIQENSELDLYVSYQAHKGDKRAEAIAADMAKQLGEKGNTWPEFLLKMAEFELTLLDWAEENKGASEYFAFANKCWPAFPEQFGFEPCYVNSHLTSQGIPVGCEVDIYGALSEYIGTCVTGGSVTLLDINNSVPQNIYDEDIKGKFDYDITDTFMGFHCGNTPMERLADGKLSYQLIMHRLLETGDPDFTRGTLNGDIAPGEITFFRLQSAADTSLHAYIAQGEVLPVATRSFGGIGVFAIDEMKRFYRHVLIEKRYPHHGAVAFGHVGKTLFDIFRMLGVTDIDYNQPKGVRYPSENPFEK